MLYGKVIPTNSVSTKLYICCLYDYIHSKNCKGYVPKKYGRHKNNTIIKDIELEIKYDCENK